MGFMNKIKNFFYDEEEIEEEIPVVKEKPKRRSKKIDIPETSEKEINIYDIEKETKKPTRSHRVPKEIESEKTSTNIFNTERTFKFPMDVEEDFEPVQVEPVKKEPKIVRKQQTTTFPPVTPSRTKRTPSYSYSQMPSSVRPAPVKKQENHFKPSPVISPIYGVLDQNYKKEDITDHSQTKEFSFDKKVDFDSIRKKAYAELDDEIEKTISDTKKDIFYNLDEEKTVEKKRVTKIEEETEKEIENEYKEEPYKKDEVIITYDEVDTDEEPEVEVPKITRSKKVAKKIEKEEDEDEDLFKIIDNMYKDTNDEEDE